MNKTQRLQQFYKLHPNRLWFSYGEHYHVASNQSVFLAALRGNEPQPYHKVLDVACAIGGNARWLASLYSCKTWGIDIDKSAIEAAKDLADIEGLDNLCNFIHGDLRDMPFADNFFDLVISTDLFEPTEVYRTLKPSGRFVLCTLVMDSEIGLKKLTQRWNFSTEWAMDVTDLAQAFYRAKEQEAIFLQTTGIIDARERVEMINQHLIPYAQGGRHLLMILRK